MEFREKAQDVAFVTGLVFLVGGVVCGLGLRAEQTPDNAPAACNVEAYRNVNRDECVDINQGSPLLFAGAAGGLLGGGALIAAGMIGRREGEQEPPDQLPPQE